MLAVIVLLGIFLRGAAADDAYNNGDTSPDTNLPIPYKVLPHRGKPAAKGNYFPLLLPYGFGRDSGSVVKSGHLPLTAMPLESYAVPSARNCKDKRGICKGPCREGFHSYNDMCYKYIHSRLCFVSAELYCQEEYGGHLASVHCHFNHLFLRNLIKDADYTCPYTWIGASDSSKEGYFFWADGTRLDHTEWSMDYPSDTTGKKNCVAMNKKSTFSLRL